MDIGLAARRRGFDLLPFGIGVRPERRPPCRIERIKCAVALLQPVTERRLTELAVAFALNLIADMPENDSGMRAEALGELCIHRTDLFTVDRRGIAVIVAAALQIADAVGADAADLRILVRHPDGLCAGGRCQNGIDAVGIELVDDIGEPVELIVALMRLQCRPCEDADGDAVDMRLLHVFNILREDLRGIQPLLRIVIAAVEQMRIRCQCLHDSTCLHEI